MMYSNNFSDTLTFPVFIGITQQLLDIWIAVKMDIHGPQPMNCNNFDLLSI